MGVVIQLLLVALWGATVGMNGWRLVRLAMIHKGWDEQPLQGALRRAWFWLGREEFWQRVQRDSMQCMQLTIMLFTLVWSLKI